MVYMPLNQTKPENNQLPIKDLSSGVLSTCKHTPVCKQNSNI